MTKGFTSQEGLTAIGGLGGSVIVALIGFGKRLHLSFLFLLLLSIFFTIYGKKLCTSCDKNCPCNPNWEFWRDLCKKKQ